VKRHWQFNDSSSGLDGPSGTRTFNQPGTHWFSLKIADNLGNESVRYSSVTVVDANSIPTGNQAPTAAFSVSFFDQYNPRLFLFNASGSSDPDGNVIYREWRVNGQLQWEGQSIYHYFPEPGTYTVELTVYDEWGASGSTSKTFKVGENQGHVLGIDSSPRSPVKNHPVYFTAEDSLAPGVDLASYKWDFGDSSSFKYGENVNHTYTSNGTYTVTLEVTDIFNQVRTTTRNVEIEDLQAPTVGLRIVDSDGVMEIRNGGTYETLRFPESFSMSTAKSQSQLPIVDAEWTFGDGNTGFGTDVNYTYFKPGTYSVSVTAYDSNGGSGLATAEIVVPEDCVF
jgi:PKD repeat protein